MHAQDVRVSGWWVLQHHDSTYEVSMRRTMGAIRLLPEDDPDLPPPSNDSHGDIQGGLLWKASRASAPTSTRGL